MAKFLVIEATAKYFTNDVLTKELKKTVKVPILPVFPELPKLPKIPPDIPLPELPRITPPAPQIDASKLFPKLPGLPKTSLGKAPSGTAPEAPSTRTQFSVETRTE